MHGSDDGQWCELSGEVGKFEESRQRGRCGWGELASNERAAPFTWQAQVRGRKDGIPKDNCRRSLARLVITLMFLCTFLLLQS